MITTSNTASVTAISVPMGPIQVYPISPSLAWCKERLPIHFLHERRKLGISGDFGDKFDLMQQVLNGTQLIKKLLNSK